MGQSKAALCSERKVIRCCASRFITPYAYYKHVSRTFLIYVGVASAIFFGCAGIPQALAATNQYVYDDAGRLVGAIDGTGASARYTYDALGNIVSIARTGATTVSILGFTPNSGTAGVSVTIYGTAFSATPSQNTVKFNGLAATVTAATTTSLKATLPASTTTGKITVTSPSGTATSAVNFVVGVASAAPTITSFTPTKGPSGTTVTITGTKFDTTTIGNKVSFNQNLARISSVTATTLTVIAPANTGSGKIRVSTSGGTATSATDFLIVPPDIVPADVIKTARIAAGGLATVLDISTADKTGALLFEGAAGNYMSLDISAITNAEQNNPATYRIYSPRNNLYTYGPIVGVGSIHLPMLPESGTYTIYLTTPSGFKSNITSSLVIDDWLALNGASLNKSITTAGLTVRMLLAGKAGQNVGIGLTNLTTSPSTSFFYLTAIAPDSAYSAGCLAQDGGCVLRVDNLPSSETLEVVFTSYWGDATASFTATLSSEVTGTLTLGSPYDLNLTRPGQSGLLSFNGVAGQNLALTFHPLSLVGPSSWNLTAAQVFDPDKTLLTDIGLGDGVDTVLALPPLPVSGTYSVLIQTPSGASSAKMRVTLTQ